MEESRIYQLKISLNGVQPPIWRRIQVPGSVSLFKLHFILQIAMGWTNSHLHEFFIEGSHYGDPPDYELDIRQIRDEKDYLLKQVITDAGVQFTYLYDFGDSWHHTVLVENILDGEGGQLYPICLQGERACPPEDVGSTGGYAEFLDAIRDTDHPEHESYLAWAGGNFEPEAFDRDRVNEVLKHIDLSEMVRVHNRYYSTEAGPEFKLYQTVSNWLAGLTEIERAQFADLPLRRDTVTLLAYLRDHRITGTQSTGNLPLKAIREVTAGFVHPPVLEEKIGDRVHKIRSEYDVWPVYFIHAITETGGLLGGGPGRKLRLTSKGEQFLSAEPAVQVWFMLESWWFHTNWLIAYPVGGIGDHLPYHFGFATLDHLLALPDEGLIPYEHFADQLIGASGLKWAAPDSTFARDSLHWSIQRMVINILESFGVVTRTYQDEWIGSYKTRKLHTFSITGPGKCLLKTLAGGSF